MSEQTDAIVVGSGPNGLSAAIVLAKAGLSVLLVEGAPNLGGSVRSANLTLPGFLHDVCSAVYPMGIASPYWKQLPLQEHGLEWIQPHYPFAHPLDNGTAVIQERSIEGTAERLGEDSRSYLKLM
jgi:phytoene dehydrogenase-like protein